MKSRATLIGFFSTIIVGLSLFAFTRQSGQAVKSQQHHPHLTKTTKQLLPNANRSITPADIWSLEASIQERLSPYKAKQPFDIETRANLKALIRENALPKLSPNFEEKVSPLDDGDRVLADYPPVEGDQYIALINGTGYDASLYRVTPIINDPETDILLLTFTQLSTYTSCPLTISDDGSVVIFVDANNYIRLLDSSGEQYLSNSGEWWSVALSPDATKLAATSVYADSSIYIFDLENPDNTKTVKLYTSTTNGTKNYHTLYADALNWDVTGSVLVYDAINLIPRSDGTDSIYWNINIMDVNNEEITPLYDELPPGIEFNNPSMAHTNDAILVFEQLDYNLLQSNIMAVDLSTGTTNLIENNGGSLAYTRYSTDDSYMVFEQYTDGYPTVRQIRLNPDKISAASTSKEFIQQAQRPFWFALGDRPTANEDEPTELPRKTSLRQNYPNPFNPFTQIQYEIAQPGRVQLTIYDATGREIETLVNRIEFSGRYTVQFSGQYLSTGLYFYTLRVDNKQITKKMLLLK